MVLNGTARVSLPMLTLMAISQRDRMLTQMQWIVDDHPSVFVQGLLDSIMIKVKSWHRWSKIYARHRKNIARGPLHPAWWAAKVKW